MKAKNFKYNSCGKANCEEDIYKIQGFFPICKTHYNESLKRNVTYNYLHKWFRSQVSQPKECELCEKEFKHLEAANISKEYKREINDFIYLCRICHLEVDFDPEEISKRTKAGIQYQKQSGTFRGGRPPICRRCKNSMFSKNKEICKCEEPWFRKRRQREDRLLKRWR